jgi:subtilisin family serine protease
MEFKVADFQLKEVIPASAYGDDLIDWGLKAVGAEIAWQKTKGKGIKVAVLDTGVDADHRDLALNIKETVDFTGSRYGVEDMQGHGSHCAGIIGAVDNQIGMVGVAPEVELYIAKVLGDNGSGGFDSITKGIQWAITKQVDVISMSLGASGRPPEMLHSVIKAAHDQGIILVAATGNENGAVCWPAMYDEVIAVSAVDEHLNRATFSNYGIKNEIAAPGVNIVSTYKQGQYARLSGTSMATPLIAGAIALIIARHKENTNGLKPDVEEVHRILTTMVKDLGAVGRDELYGLGMINLSLLP